MLEIKSDPAEGHSYSLMSKLTECLSNFRYKMKKATVSEYRALIYDIQGFQKCNFYLIPMIAKFYY